MRTRLLSRAVRLLAAVLLFAATAAYASDEGEGPRGTVCVIVPFPAGGGTDIAARIFVEGLNERLGRHFIIENKDGATTMIGTEVVARSKPDGNTLLYTSTPFSINPSLRRHMPFDTGASFTP